MKKGAPNPNGLQCEATLPPPPPPLAAQATGRVGRQITCFLCSKELSNSNHVRKYPKILSKSPKLPQDHYKVTGLFNWVDFFCIEKIHETNFSIIFGRNIVGKLKICRQNCF